MSFKKIRISLFALLFGALILAACQPQEVVVTQVVEREVVVTQEVERVVTQEVTVIETVEVPVELEQGPQGTIVSSLTTFPNALYPPQAAERNASTAGWHMYSTLVWINGDQEVEPDLATDWTISDDGLEYTFNLRDDVTFHNGEPFNADAVVFSWERAVAANFEYSYFWTAASGVEKIDEYTVKITLPEPQPTFLATVADNWAMAPPGYIAEVGEEGYTENPVGTGPFMFVEWVKGDRIVMEAYPDFYREPGPLVQTLIFRPIPESSTRVAAVRTGEIDIAKRLSADEAQSLLGVEGVKVVSYPVDRVYYIAFNNLSTGIGEPTEDPLVRQAMNYAVNRQDIVDALFNGFGRLSTSFVTPANFGFNTAIEPFPYDPDMAVQLLTEAGYPNGFDLEFRCPIGAYTNFEQVCEAIQGYLTAVGINTNLEFMESGQYWDLESRKELPGIFGDSWSNAGVEPIDRIEGALLADNSYAAWSTPDLTDLIRGLRTTVSDDARRQLYFDYQEMMQADPPMIWLYEPFAFEAISTRVQNYLPRPAENYFLGYDGTFVVENP